MSDYSIKKNTGLAISHKHRSANGQVDASQVYKKIDGATEVQSMNASQSIISDRASTALRLGLDRLSRLGERMRENSNVSVRDMRHMKEESDYLRETLHRIASGKLPAGFMTDKISELDLADAPGQLDRVIHGIFNGQIKLTDRVDSLGGLIDQEVDPRMFQFSGDFSLKDAKVEYAPVSATEILSTRDHYTGALHTIELGGSSEGSKYVDAAIDRVRQEILTGSKQTVEIHAGVGHFTDFKLFFG